MDGRWKHDLGRLQASLRASKAEQARSQAVLDDPGGADLLARAHQIFDNAVAAGDVERAAQARAVFEELEANRAAVLQAHDEVMKAERLAMETIRSFQAEG